MEVKGKVCSFCCDTVQDDLGNTDKITMQIFQTLLVEVYMDNSENQTICGNCIEIAKRCMQFKSTIMNTETNILIFAITRRKTFFDIKDMYENCTFTVDEDVNLCRFCLSLLEETKFLRLDTVMNKSSPQLLPELDWDVIRNPLICTTCESNLQSYLKLVTGALRIMAKSSNTNIHEEETSQKNRYELLFKDILGPPHSYKKPAKNQELDIVENTDEKQVALYKRLHENVPQITSEEIGKSDVVTTVKRYTCPRCSFKTSYKSVLEVHILVHDNNKAKKITCTSCPFQATLESDMKTHMVLHEHPLRVDNYQCTVCHYRTQKKGVFAKHLKIHKATVETEIYKCCFCPYKATLKKTLDSHLLVHRDLGMYRCSLCDYKTKTRAVLKKHIASHTGAKSSI